MKRWLWCLGLALAFCLGAGSVLADATPTPAPGETAMPYYGKAYVDNPDPGDRLNLREGPGTGYTSIGLYYNGAEALCWSDPAEGDWVLVTIGQVAGYMRRPFLRLEGDGEPVTPATYRMTVANPEEETGLHLRRGPNLSAESLGLYPNGQEVLVLGIAGDWAHVSVAGETGYMLRDYLSRAEKQGAAPAATPVMTLPPVATAWPKGTAAPEKAAQPSPRLKADGRGAEGFRYLEQGYTVVGAVSELQDGDWYAHCIVGYDKNYAAAEALAGFRLYLNGEAAATLTPDGPEAGEAGLPTAFRCTFAFAGELASARLVPVWEAAGEDPAGEIGLMLR